MALAGAVFACTACSPSAAPPRTADDASATTGATPPGSAGAITRVPLATVAPGTPLEPLLADASFAYAGTVLGMRRRDDPCGAYVEIRLAREVMLAGRATLLRDEVDPEGHELRIVARLADAPAASGPASPPPPRDGSSTESCGQVALALATPELASGDRVVVAVRSAPRTDPRPPPWKRSWHAAVVAPLSSLPQVAAALPVSVMLRDGEQDVPVPRLPGLGTPRGRELLGARPRFEARGEEVVDRALGVVWQRGTAPRPLHVFEAAWSCEALRLAGHDDWRLPTAVELQALLEPGGDAPALRRRDLFPTPAEGYLWSRTDDDGSWLGALDGGAIVSSHYDDPHPYGPYAARCVRGGDAPRTLPLDRFAARGEALDDALSGLTWHLPRSATPVTHAAAQQACAASTALGHDDWRLPEGDEMFALMSGCPDALVRWAEPLEEDEVWTRATDRASGVGLVHDSCDLMLTAPLAAAFGLGDPDESDPRALTLCVRTSPPPVVPAMDPCPSVQPPRRVGHELRCETDGVADGPFRSFHPGGAVFEVGSHARGQRTGPFTMFHELGGVWARGTYVAGELDGELVVTRPTGLTLATQRFAAGVPAGTWRWMDPSAREVETLAWTEGQPAAGRRVHVFEDGDGSSTCPTWRGLEHGIDRWVDGEGSVTAEVPYVAGVAEGLATYGGSGTRRVGTYRDGLRHGVWTTTRADGTLESRWTYADELLDGPFEIFDTRGALVSSQTFAKGRRVGPFELRDPSGNVSTRGELDGAGNGRVVTLRVGGAVASEEHLVAGQPHGVARTFGEGGRLLRETTFRHGKEHGTVTRYHPDGTPESIETWRDGVRHGLHRETAPDGTDLVVGTYVEGEKDGPWMVTIASGVRLHVTFAKGRAIAVGEPTAAPRRAR